MQSHCRPRGLGQGIYKLKLTHWKGAMSALGHKQTLLQRNHNVRFTPEGGTFAVQ